MDEKPEGMPQTPGVYIMKGRKREIIYVGKAKNIRKRLTQYFARERSAKTMHLVNRASKIDFISTNNEVEALLLENQLIKKHQPHYNIDLKDDKDYPYFCITGSEKYPRLIIERRITWKKTDPKNRYFGHTALLWANLHAFYRIILRYASAITISIRGSMRAYMQISGDAWLHA